MFIRCPSAAAHGYRSAVEPWTPPNQEYPPPKPGEPDLHRGARLGDAEGIRRLVAEGAALDAAFDIQVDPGAKSNPATPLMVATGSGDGASVETVRLLLELGADPKQILARHSAASFACMGLGWNYRPGGDAARLHLLLEAGCPLPAEPEAANRVVCRTARSGDVARLEILLARGLSARGHFDPEQARRQHLAFMNAMRAARDETSGALPEEVQASIEVSRTELEAELLGRAALGPWSHDIPLFCAAESGSAACLRAILDAGADVRARDRLSRTAVYCEVNTEVLRLLIDAGLSLEDRDEHGWSPLMEVVGGGQEAMARLRALIDAGADVNATYDGGCTVFMCAVNSKRHLEIQGALIAAGANRHAVTERGCNAFHAAVDLSVGATDEASVRATLEYLKELGVDMERRSSAGLTPLAMAIESGTGMGVRVLCELGADPNVICGKHECGEETCERIDAPLLFHAADGIGVHRDVKTEALLRAGADPLAQDSDGCTALSRVVAAVCADAPDQEAAFDDFLNRLGELRYNGPLPAVRDEHVAAVMAGLRPFVEGFCAEIPPGPSDFDARLRRERVSCIVSLCAWESWPHHGFPPRGRQGE